MGAGAQKPSGSAESGVCQSSELPPAPSPTGTLRQRKGRAPPTVHHMIPSRDSATPGQGISLEWGRLQGGQPVGGGGGQLMGMQK